MNISDMQIAKTDFTATQAVIYDDTPRPKWWRHPIKWWRWEQNIIGFIDLGEPYEQGDFTIEFPKSESSGD